MKRAATGRRLLAGDDRPGYLFLCPRTKGPFRLAGKDAGNATVISVYVHELHRRLGFPDIDLTGMNARFFFVDWAMKRLMAGGYTQAEMDAKIATYCALMETTREAWNAIYSRGTAGRNARTAAAAGHVAELYLQDAQAE